MLNMGGPRNSGEVNQFLKNLFADRDIIKLPWQVILIERRLWKERIYIIWMYLWIHSCYADSIQLGCVSPHDGHEAVISNIKIWNAFKLPRIVQ